VQGPIPEARSSTTRATADRDARRSHSDTMATVGYVSSCEQDGDEKLPRGAKILLAH